MKKKLFRLCLILLALALLAGAIGPHLILAAVRQPEPENGFAYSDSFHTEYDQVRSHLQALAASLEAETYSYPLDKADGLYIDTLYLPASAEQTNLVVLTTGVHGIEGYIGAVMLDVFFGEVWPRLDPENTGILVVANVNPYGMKYLRRYNENRRAC